MKIGVVRFNLTASGGAERYALNLIGALIERGHEPHVFTARLPSSFPEGARAHLFQAPLRRRNGKSLLPRFLRPRAFRRWLQAELKSSALDLLFVTEPIWPNDVFRAGGGVHREWLQIVARESGGPFAPLKRAWTHLAPFDRAALRDETQLFQAAHSGLVVCNSEMVAREITRHYPYPRERIRVVPNGVGQREFQPATPAAREALRSERDLQAGDLALLFVGSGLWRKGLDLSIDIVAALRDEMRKRAATLNVPARRLRFFVVGHGALDAYRKQARALKLEDEVVFVGGLGHGEVLQWYQASDIFLFPTRYDPFANACLEANACGLPVVTTTRNGFSEHIQNKNGLVLQAPHDAPSAAREIADLMENAPSPQTVREALAHLSLENHIALLLDAIQNAK